jgi:hypothetical protein
LLEWLEFIQTSFGPLDLGSSQKEIGSLHCPRQLQFFSEQNSIDVVHESIECYLSITPAYFIPF